METESNITLKQGLDSFYKAYEGHLIFRTLSSPSSSALFTILEEKN
jgi:hypothetical protein